MRTTEPGTCSLCGKPKEGHRGVHPFTPEGQDAGTDWLKTKKREEEPPPSLDTQLPLAQFPFDPVLRMALINKGVLTAEDLTSAENQIKAIGGALNGH